MSASRFLNVVILSILTGFSALIYAQDEKPQENKPSQQEEPKTEKQGAKPSTQEQAKPSKDEKKEQKQEQKQQPQGQMKPEGQERPQQGMEHAQPQTQGQAEQAGKPAGKGHIPDDKFRAHFGRSHTFAARTVIVQGQPQFQYGGYSFQLVDAWPMGWAYTDECYIDYINGEYFLFDLLHPGVQVAVIVIL